MMPPSDLPTRACDGCGQVWASGSFLDPTTQAICGFCGGSLVHRRRLPNVRAVELERMVAAPDASSNGARQTIAPLR
jgi:hypothetical protein